MKKYFIALTLAGCLMVSLSSSVFAASNSVYFDGLVGGKNTIAVKDQDDQSKSLNCYIIGGEYQFNNKIKVAGEYAFGKEEKTDEYADADDADFNALLIKGDYKVYNKKKLRLDAAAGYYNRSYDKFHLTLNGILIGCDATYTINKKSSVKGDVGFLLGGKYAVKGSETDDKVTSLIVNLKYTYLVKSNIGITGGYRYIGTSFDESNGDLQYIHSGLSVGAVYKF